jgi:glycosyltransferase involved in cell wall biosynthesis
MHPTVSVIVPAFNAKPWIAEALTSVLSQTVPPGEVIVVDDGSTDGTPEAVRQFGSSVRYERRANSGAGAARNLGLRLAKGEYVAFLDADDLWLPEKLEKQLNLFSANPDIAWAYCDSYIFSDREPGVMTRVGRHLKLRDGYIFESLLLGDFIASPTPIVHRDVFARVGGFVQQPSWVVFAEDWDMWLRIAQHHPVGLVNEPLTKYRLTPSGKSRSAAGPWRHMVVMEVVNRAIRGNPAVSAGLAKRARHRACLSSAERMIARQETEEARNVILAALSYRVSARALAYLVMTFCPCRVQDTIRHARRTFRRIPSPL